MNFNETFSAAAAEPSFQGRNVHPWYCKGQMVNTLQLAIDFHNQLPENDQPELSRWFTKVSIILWMYPGSVEGRVLASHLEVLKGFLWARKAAIRSIADKDESKELGNDRVTLTLDQYYNRGSRWETWHTLPLLNCYGRFGIITPIIEPIRSGARWL